MEGTMNWNEILDAIADAMVDYTVDPTYPVSPFLAAFEIGCELLDDDLEDDDLIAAREELTDRLLAVYPDEIK
jgi:hypothetical protein